LRHKSGEEFSIRGPGTLLLEAFGRNCVVCCGADERAISVKNYIAAIDQGTTSTRFMVFDESARTAAVAQKEQLYKQWKKAVARSFDWVES
jgi:2-C-methyl-D-erythritol 4-phosphate cytidylyltransferase